MENGQLANQIIVDPEEMKIIRDMNLLTIKPMIYVLNVDEDNIYQETDYIPISAKITLL